MKTVLPPLQVLFEDNHCIAVCKPAGVLTTGYQGKEETLARQVKAYLRVKHGKPGNVFLGVVHRLDRPVSGVLLFARTSKAAARLARQFREGGIDKVYWAVVEGVFDKPSGTLEDWMRKDRERRRVEVTAPHEEGSRQALLHFQRRGGNQQLTWIEVRPQTGRTHQIRVQFAHRGHPIYGDAKYGSVHTFADGIALHARGLTFLHPIRFEPIALVAELPEPWRRFRQLGVRVRP
jgi:23S rRNA pseudouridine1911/1915/1917 synthase